MAEAIIRKALSEPILEQGLRSTHFFNGRLLTATDFTVEQLAQATQHRQLGQAIGAGVVEGLEVLTIADGAGGQSPVLQVSAGMALNQQGQILELPAAIELTLAQTPPAAGVEVGRFAVCGQVATAPVTARGLFVLVAGPASGYQESAPLRSPGDNGKVEGCGSRYTVEGIRFRLAEFKPDALVATDPTLADAGLVALISDLTTKTDPASLSMLRNLLAHLCFGTASLAGFGADPLRQIGATSPYLAYGALDALWTSGGLTRCEVPLALVFWPVSGVKFVDLWPVRRRLVEPLPSLIWPLHAGARRPAEVEAIFLQFQDQIREMLGQSGLAAVAATGRFRYLPAAGYLPIGTGQFTSAGFFAGLTTTTQELDTAYLRLLVHQSWYLDPIDLVAPPPIRLYQAAGSPGYLLFVRDQAEIVVEPPAEQSPPDTPPTTKTGRINVTVGIGGKPPTKGSGFLKKSDKLGESLEVLGVKTPNQDLVADLPNEIVIPPATLQVFAKDSLGNTYPAKAVTKKLPLGAGALGDIVFSFGAAHFIITGLAPDTYKVYAKLKGFKDASVVRTVAAGQTVSVQFTLVPKGKTPGGKPTFPKPGLDIGWADKGWYDLLYPLEKEIKWPWPPEEIGPEFDLVTDPPPFELETPIEAWTDYLRDIYPDAPINPGDIGVYINRDYVPGSIAEAPYAYLTFGEGGAYMPVLLATPDQTHDRPISLDKAGLPGMDMGLAAKMAAAGVGSVEMLSAAWTGLVSEITGAGMDAAEGYIAGARARGEALQGSLLQFDGVDTALAGELAVAGVDGPAALANADAATLAAGVQAAGFDATFAQILVSAAQSSVPPAQWSLAAPELGLKQEEIDGLVALGIKTQGELKTGIADDATKQAVAGVLNITTGQVDTLAGGIQIRSGADIRLDRVGAAPVTNVFGVSATTGRVLADAGVATVAALANANAADLTGFFGDPARAAAAVNAARLRVGL